RTASYLALNNTLLIAFIFFTWTLIKQARKKTQGRKSSEDNHLSQKIYNADVTLFIWFITSYAGVATGGRFYGHYFFQILPALSLIGARGLSGIISTLKTTSSGETALRRSERTRKAVLVLLAVGFIFTLIRFHGRTAELAIDWMRGVRGKATAGWLHERLNR